MAYVSAEQTEEPSKTDHQLFPEGLPQFKKEKHPLSDLRGDSVFMQDEQSEIKLLGFANQQIAAVLSAEVEFCRKSHQGHVLRQQINVERCSIVEYRYQSARKEYSIFVNPSHRLVEDTSGPIQTAIEKMDALAQKAFDEKRYEDAYRLNLRSICMDEASEEERKLRDQIIKRLTGVYRDMALLTWLAASLAWLFFCTTAPGQHGNFGAFIGLFPLLGGVYLFARDTALRFQQRSSRVASAVLIGFSAFLSGAAINVNSFDWNTDNHWVDWLPFVVVILALVVMAIARANERSRRIEIEKHMEEFPDVQALESYVCGLDPKNGVGFRAVFGMSVVVLCLLSSVAGLAAYHMTDKQHPVDPNAVDTAPNPTETFQINLKAAEQDNAEAQNNLALMYAKGDGVAKNSVEAVKWFTKAAEQGFARAQNNLGVMYDNGEGVTQNSMEAVKWFTKAAEQGFAEAQYNLGIMYHEGEGVPEDYVQAAKWYNLAVLQGHEGARNRYLELTEKMTPEQIDLAQKMTKEFVPKNAGQ
jgi:Sel1 repeat